MGVEAAEDGVVKIFFLNLRQDVGLDLIRHRHRATVIQLINLWRGWGGGAGKVKSPHQLRAAMQTAWDSVSTVGGQVDLHNVTVTAPELANDLGFPLWLDHPRSM